MALNTATIGTIVEQELLASDNHSIKNMGMQLYGEWLQTQPGVDFCQTRIYPAIQGLRKNLRMKALEVLHRIKDKIATRAADETKEEEMHRQSAELMKREIRQAYEVVRQVGRGVAIFGSARTKEGQEYYEQTVELARHLSVLLGCPIWSGGGPGQMDAASRGGKIGSGKTGAVKIDLSKNSHFNHEQEISPFLERDHVAVCNYFAPRKVGLVDAIMRMREEDRTGMVKTPGGFGTEDEFFELLTLIQTGKLGTQYPIPIAIMSYNGFYDGQMTWIRERMLGEGMISPKDLDLFEVCHTNREALDYFADFYKIPASERHYPQNMWQEKDVHVA